MNENEININYNRIKDKIFILKENITNDNEQLEKLEKTVDYLKNDEEWLKIIENWLDKIITSVNIIKRDWSENFSEMLNKILKSV